MEIDNAVIPTLEALQVARDILDNHCLIIKKLTDYGLQAGDDVTFLRLQQIRIRGIIDYLGYVMCELDP